MVESLEKWKIFLITWDFIVGTIFLGLIFLTFFLQYSILSGEQLLFGSLFLLLLGGFFMYIFTPPLVTLFRSILTSTKHRIIPPFCVFVIFTIYRIVVPISNDPLVTFFQICVSFIFILTPSFLYLLFHEQIREGLSIIDIFAGLWVWLPIEFGIVDDLIGSVELGDIPFETLLALFAFIYALIFIRHHDMGLTFSITKKDLVMVLKVISMLFLAILPLGILSHFLASPDRIWENFMELVMNFPSSLTTVILTFFLIFLGTALIEEIFFRGFVFNLLKETSQKQISINWWYGGLVGLVGLITITPWIDNVLQIITQLFPPFSPIRDIVGSLDKPLGSFEGETWPLVQSVPLELVYLIVAVALGIIGFLLINKSQNPIITALVLGSILFGWAHFEDIRYIFFASIAGFGYGLTYWKTEKIVPAALVHTTVNTIWGMLLLF